MGMTDRIWVDDAATVVCFCGLDRKGTDLETKSLPDPSCADIRLAGGRLVVQDDFYGGRPAGSVVDFTGEIAGCADCPKCPPPSYTDARLVDYRMRFVNGVLQPPVVAVNLSYVP